MTHFCVVREDLPLGMIAAQLIHAAGESSPGNLSEGTYAIALAVPDEQGLKALIRELHDHRVEHVIIREPDAPYYGQLMAIGIVPRPRSTLTKILSKFPLLKRSKCGSSSVGRAAPS